MRSKSEHWSRMPTTHILALVITLVIAGVLWLAFSWWSVRFLYAYSQSDASLLQFALHEWPFQTEDFVRDKWLAGAILPDGDWDCIRGSMVHSILEEHIAGENVDKSFVEELLGAPDGSGMRGFAAGEEDVEGCMFYELGACSGFQIDLDTLYVCYSPDGVVVASGHYQS